MEIYDPVPKTPDKPEEIEKPEKTKMVKEAPPDKVFLKEKNEGKDLSIPHRVLLKKQLEENKALGTHNNTIYKLIREFLKDCEPLR